MRRDFCIVQSCFFNPYVSAQGFHLCTFNKTVARFCSECGDDMPAMLHKLLCDERQLPRGNLPKGAVCADQIEKQLLYDQATKQKSVDFVKKLNTDPSIVSNFSTMRYVEILVPVSLFFKLYQKLWLPVFILIVAVLLSFCISNQF